MNLEQLISSVGLIASVALFAACGNNDTTPAKVQSTDLAQFVAAPEDMAKACVSSCSEDSECQNSCPGVATGVNCCDVQTNLCYVSNTSTCPVPATPDMAESQSMY